MLSVRGPRNLSKQALGKAWEQAAPK